MFLKYGDFVNDLSVWSSDFNNLYGLANQLKAKTSLQQTNTPILKQQLEAEYIQFNLDNREKHTSLKANVKLLF